MPKTRDELQVTAKLFRGLGDVSRLAILEALFEGRLSVSQIVDRTGLSQPSASMHLDCLWCCGLVEREMAGRYTFYWIGSKKVRQLLAAAKNTLGEVYERIDECKRYEERKSIG